ncbi:hypothetical protein CYJ10_13795 [Cupriavidus pauculus]|uniref:Uncharacterized protein n=2 Tax=Cupriavidus pauculus TaxID=82633 RepID=A0A2N5CDA4_9BURK|nr:hypothetical protein CYJ10_13795 [Cupriavidus pauculus]
MRYLVPAMLVPVLLSACNTAPIPPGKSVSVQAALDNITRDMCAFRQKFAQSPQGAAVDSYTVELVLTVDAERQPPVAVAPDIAFMPTVTYGNTLMMAKDSRLVVTFRNTDTGGAANCPTQ